MSVRLRVRVWVRIRVSVRVSTPMFAIAPLKLHISHDYLRSVTTGTSEPRLWKQKHAAAWFNILSHPDPTCIVCFRHGSKILGLGNRKFHFLNADDITKVFTLPRDHMKITNINIIWKCTPSSFTFASIQSNPM